MYEVLILLAVASIPDNLCFANASGLSSTMGGCWHVGIS